MGIDFQEEGPGFSASLTGFDKLAAKLKALAKEYPQVIYDQLAYEADEILADAVDRCPESPDGGALRASGRVVGASSKGRITASKINKIEVRFGNSATQEYAIAVHEHLSDASPPSWVKAVEGRIRWTVPGTGPKFLEKAYKAAEKGLLGRCREAVRRWG